MRRGFICLLVSVLASTLCQAQVADKATFLTSTQDHLRTEWPKNRRINLVFHGHSVPGGFWENHEVHTLQSYPHLVLKALKEKYPYALINVIITAVGGENAITGQRRFDTDVLNHKPDVLFIDYALNDRFSPLDKTREAWEQMIVSAKSRNIPVILLTPSPDQRIDISDTSNPLEPYVKMIRELAEKHQIGLADPYPVFQNEIREGRLKQVMASVNHPNENGHTIIAKTILPYFY